MALDVGEVRIGVAVCDDSEFLASPYTTLHVSRDEQQNWVALQRLIDETGAEGLVIGLPISLDGQIHTQGKRIQAFAERLRPHITLPITFWDERLSTVEAQRLSGRQHLESGGKRQRRNGQQSFARSGKSKRRRHGQEIDALAATVILQDYLDSSGRRTEEENV